MLSWASHIKHPLASGKGFLFACKATCVYFVGRYGDSRRKETGELSFKWKREAAVKCGGGRLAIVTQRSVGTIDRATSGRCGQG